MLSTLLELGTKLPAPRNSGIVSTMWTTLYFKLPPHSFEHIPSGRDGISAHGRLYCHISGLRFDSGRPVKYNTESSRHILTLLSGISMDSKRIWSIDFDCSGKPDDAPIFWDSWCVLFSFPYVLGLILRIYSIRIRRQGHSSVSFVYPLKNELLNHA